jgi:hypothetical protein
LKGIMPIDNVPAVQEIIEQVGLLERAFHSPLDANLAYSRLADEEMFPNGIGETLTKTRPALFPLNSALTPINPANNTGLDNGLGDNYYTFEQYVLAINEYALSTQVNIMQDRTLIQRIFLQNYVALGENAGRTMDGLCSQYVHTSYDSGNTFATAAVSGGLLALDNANGFDTAFNSNAGFSPGAPSPVSNTNPLAFTVYDGTTGLVKGQGNVIGCAFDLVNTSSAFVNGIAYGRSGEVTVSGYTGTAIADDDNVVAVDGSVIIRPNGKRTRDALDANDLVTLQTIAQAVAKLKARNVPTLPNGMYLAIIDPTIWPQLLSDQAFQRSTMGQMGEGGSYFAFGQINRTLGVEFVNSNLVPAFKIPSNGSLFARHIVVGGRGLLIKGTFQGSLDAAAQANTMQNADIKLIVDAKISLITRGPLDRLQEFVTQTWRWVGGFVTPTDVTSTPLIIPTTDYSRYKRCVVIEVASNV